MALRPARRPFRHDFITEGRAKGSSVMFWTKLRELCVLYLKTIAGR
jgi:hypothetical protein